MSRLFDGNEEDQKRRGVDAAHVLENPSFILAEHEARQRIHDEWESEEDAHRRDRLWHEVRAIGALRQELESIRSNGEHSGERLKSD